MDKVSKKSLKGLKTEKSVEEIIPKLKKSKKINALDESELIAIKQENVEEIAIENSKKSKKKKSEVKIIETSNVISSPVEEKVKKSKKRKAAEVDITEETKTNADIAADVHEVEIKKIKTHLKEEKMEVDNSETVNIITTPLYNALIVNLPSEVSKEELINFLSNRGIPIDGLQLNSNKYAIVEAGNIETLNQITNLISTKPMENNTDMKVSQLHGNQLKLSNFTAKKPVANRRVIIVKNVPCKTDIANVLSKIDNKDDILRHSSVIVRNFGAETQMLTVEFKSSEHTDEVLEKLNDVTIDGHKLSAEHKVNLIDTDHSENLVKTDSLIVKNLPLSATKETIIGLTKKFDVNPKSIHLLPRSGKNCCYVKFNGVKKASEAFDVLKDELVEGLKLEVKFVAEPKESVAGELARTKLIITNLPFTVKKEDMEKEFDGAESVKLPMTGSGRSKGVCYVSFNGEEMAALAMDAVQDRIIGGRKIKCEYVPMSVAFEDADIKVENKRREAMKPKEKPIGAVLTLFNLPAGVTQKDIIGNFANVKLVNIVKKGESFKGIAEVHFKDAAAAHVAMSAPEWTLKGRVIRKELKGGNWRIGTMTKKVPKAKVTKTKRTDSDDESGSDAQSDASESTAES